MRLRNLLSVAMAAIFAAGLIVPATQAQSSGTTVWVEFTSVRAPHGCVVDVSVDGGASLAGASISLVVSDDDTGAIVSSDSDTANSNGIVWLAIDTNGAGETAKLWASVNINGSYLSGRTVRVSPDGSCASGGDLVTMRGDVPATSDGNSSPETVSTNAVIIPGAVGYQQQRGLSCEYASLAIATGMLGHWVSEYDFEAVTPLNANPHWGYRGDINGSWGNTDNYGVYSAPLVDALNHFGFQGDAWYGDSHDLVAQLDLGRPTLVWIGARGEAGTFNEYTADGTRYQLTPYMHAVTIYGYDDAGVYVSDPGNGKKTHWNWNAFEDMWDVMDGMALSVYW